MVIRGDCSVGTGAQGQRGQHEVVLLHFRVFLNLQVIDIQWFQDLAPK